MFFEDRIKSILPNDRVLEVGPGATPYHRSDIFLEKKFGSDEELIAQSGNIGLLTTMKRIVYYDGNCFPFKDNEFDYVICSHVLEHVPNIDQFVRELQRVAKKGYIEFPTVYYDYIYNFPEHIQIVFYKDNCIYWMPKNEIGLDKFSPVQEFFYESCTQQYYKFIDDFRNYFFQGFEWFETIKTEKVWNFNKLVYQKRELNFSLIAKPNNFRNRSIKIKLKNLIKTIINKM